MNGLLPDDPLSLSECRAVLLYMLPELDKSFGKQRSHYIGKLLGESYGKAITRAKYLYRNFDNSTNRIDKIAEEFLSMLLTGKTKYRAATLNAYTDTCAVYEVPVIAIISGATAASK